MELLVYGIVFVIASAIATSRGYKSPLFGVAGMVVYFVAVAELDPAMPSPTGQIVAIGVSAMLVFALVFVLPKKDARARSTDTRL